MRKTVEVEYVGIEDVTEIADSLYALMREGHYINFEITSLFETPCVIIKIILGGWDGSKEYDYQFKFDLSDDPYDVQKMNECKRIINSLLAEVE